MRLILMISICMSPNEINHDINSLSKSSDPTKRSLVNFTVCESLHLSHKLINAIINMNHTAIRQLTTSKPRESNKR